MASEDFVLGACPPSGYNPTAVAHEK